MSKHILSVVDAEVKFADDEAGLTTGTEFSCQVISAAINTSQTTNTAPATFCDGETDIVGKSKYSLDLRWLQDWDLATGSLSMYLYDNDALPKWVSITLTDQTAPSAVGEVTCAAGAYGGDAGAPLEATSTMPFRAKPAITPGMVTPAAPAMAGV